MSLTKSLDLDPRLLEEVGDLGSKFCLRAIAKSTPMSGKVQLHPGRLILRANWCLVPVNPDTRDFSLFASAF
ncbi:hypothetical protein [Nostoc sp.]|uniref:hypothetical protein n=1 Tax=Nostoc sp. TaxID=1180 RepID=UPI002FFCA707